MTKLLATDLILANRPGDPTTIINKIANPDEKDRTYIRSMKTWCAAAGIDPFLALSQWAVETDNGRSPRWNNDNNPGGVGIPADSTVQPFVIANGDEAARIHVQALYSAVTKHLHDDIPMPVASVEWFTELWLPKVNNRNYPGVRIVDDLNTRYIANGDAHATWAWDSEYITTLINRCSLFYPDLQPQSKGGAPVADKPKPLTFGKVPHPAYQDRQIWKKEGVGMNNLGKRSVKGVTWHRILGSLWGTDGYFRNPTVAALTDYGVGVTATDGANNDGVILRWNDPLGYQSGWASGTYSSYAYGDGELFVNKYGVNAINRDRASIEISGSQNTPLSPNAKQAIAAITAYWADQYQIPWDQFPNAPQDGFSFVTWHEEFGPDQGQKKCPFDVVKGETPELIKMTADIMKQHQTQAVTPVPPSTDKYAPPITYPWLAQDDGKVHKVGGTRVLPLTLTYTTTRSTPRYQTGSKTGAKIGPNIAKGTTFSANRVFRSSEGIAFVMTRYGSRVLASALTPRVGVTATGRISVRNDEEGEPEIISDNVEAKA